MSINSFNSGDHVLIIPSGINELSTAIFCCYCPSGDLVELFDGFVFFLEKSFDLILISSSEFA